jgi:hypothetical protein
VPHNVELLRLNFGVFVLLATQIKLNLVVPSILEASGAAVTSHGKAHLPVTGLSFVMMGTGEHRSREARQNKAPRSANGLILIGQLLLGVTVRHTVNLQEKAASTNKQWIARNSPLSLSTSTGNHCLPT